MISDIVNTNMYELMIVCIRSLASLVILFITTKIIGKKQVSELNLFDYVISISIGNFAAEISMNVDVQLLNGLVAVVIFGLVASFVSFLTMKSIKLRRFFMGVPTVIIQDGKLIYENLKRLKFDINDLLEIARISGHFDISEIKYAIMEANGKVSFMPYFENTPVMNKDLNIKNKNIGLTANVIIDGNIMDNNLKMINKDDKWLLKELKIKGYNDINNILLATVDINEKINIYEKDNKIIPIDVLE